MIGLALIATGAAALGFLACVVLWWERKRNPIRRLPWFTEGRRAR